MMTNFQRQMAARKLCELRGQDPDEEQTRPRETAHPIYATTRKRLWQFASDEIQAAEQTLEAIEFGRLQ